MNCKRDPYHSICEVCERCIECGNCSAIGCGQGIITLFRGVPTPDKLDKYIEVARRHGRSWITDVDKLNIVHQMAMNVVAYPTDLNLQLLKEACLDAENG